VIAAAGVIALLLAAPAIADRCQPLVPSGLAIELAKAYPEHRLPRGTDQDDYNVRQHLAHGGSGCLGVAEGDFDGDKRRDVALLLASRARPETLIVVALRRAKHWQLELLDTWDVRVASYYVDVVAPGLYESPFAEHPPLRTHQVPAIESRNEGVAAGQLESTALFYFRMGERWQFVWMSD